MREALKENAWILKINPNTVVTVGHIREFFTLWMLVHDFHLDEQTEDDIVWEHSNGGIYTTSTTYEAQFLGLTLSPMDLIVWKVCPHPKLNSLHGWHYKIRFGPTIVWIGAVGEIVAFDYFAKGNKKRGTSFLQVSLHD